MYVLYIFKYPRQNHPIRTPPKTRASTKVTLLLNSIGIKASLGGPQKQH